MTNLADAIFFEAYYQKQGRRVCGRVISRPNFAPYAACALRARKGA